LSLGNLNASGQTFSHDAARSVLTEALSRSQKEVKKLEDSNMRLQRDSKRTIDAIDILLTPDYRLDSPENECQTTYL